jgi:hypothetical protein
VLVSITHVAAHQTVTAEIWRPARLVAAFPTCNTDEVSDRRRVWRYGDMVDERSVGREVADLVATWLAELAESRPSGLGSRQRALVG